MKQSTNKKTHYKEISNYRSIVNTINIPLDITKLL